MEVANAPIAKESLVACKDAKAQILALSHPKRCRGKKHNLPENSKVVVGFFVDGGIQVRGLCILLRLCVEENESFWLSA